jgi:hypothetical protein
MDGGVRAVISPLPDDEGLVYSRSFPSFWRRFPPFATPVIERGERGASMTITCPGCGRAIAVPPDKVGIPNLKARCSCGSTFPLAEALRLVGSKAPATPPTRPAPAVPPRPSVDARPPAPIRASVAVPSPVSPATVRLPSRPHPGQWRRCVNHPQARSESVCRACNVGYCGECARKVQNASICPECDGLCLATAAFQEENERERQRAQPLTDDLGLIFGYPFRDRWAFVLLALFTWFFGLMKGFSGFAYLLSEGILMWYCFSALSKVAVGNTREFMPEFRDISDVAGAVRLGLAALVVSTGPLLLLVIYFGLSSLPLGSLFASDTSRPIVHAQEAGQPPTDYAGGMAELLKEEPPPSQDETGEGATEAQTGRGFDHSGGEAGPGPMLLAMFLLALAWKVLYTPVALTVAALSRSILSTLNPVIGFDTILKMGSVYWQCLAIYTPLAVVQLLLGLGLAKVPIAGGLVRSFVDAYAYLVIGCILGLGVFKKARELGWD